MSARRVAACVVTGYLGSGKTTLLRGLLDRDPSAGRIAVFVNEIGEIGIDGRVLTGFEFVENVVELSSGCICCSIDEYRFDLAIDEVVRRLDPLLVVIETTGVADPQPTVGRLARCGLGVDAIVTVVDAVAWAHAWRISRVARRQIEAADFLVITKGDVAGAAGVAKLRRRLEGIQPRAAIFESTSGAPFAGAELLFATSAARHARLRPSAPGERQAPEHLDDEGIESFAWRSAIPVDPDRLRDVLANLPANVVRAKGFVRGSGERSVWLFQLVCGRVDLTVIEAGAAVGEGAEGVFIGPGVLPLRDDVLARLASCASAASGVVAT